MYSVDKRDRVVELSSLPKPMASAPSPFIVSDEHVVLLAYIVDQVDRSWDGSYVSHLGPSTPNQKLALAQFSGCRCFMFGAPNDEAFGGHPLASKGLRPHSVFEVKESSWIRQLEHMNRVHPMHMPRVFDTYRHFIFGFQDSTFECVADTVEIATWEGTLGAAFPKMEEILRKGWTGS